MPQSILASLHTLLNTSKYPFELQFSLHECPKPSWQTFWPPYNQANTHLNFNFHCTSAPNHPCKHFDPPQNQAYVHLNLDNSSLNKRPKPSWQALRPPPSPYGQCPNKPGKNFRGASLTLVIMQTYQLETALFCNQLFKPRNPLVLGSHQTSQPNGPEISIHLIPSTYRLEHTRPSYGNLKQTKAGPWMKVDESGWKWQKSGWKWMKWMKVDESGLNGWKWMTVYESGWE